MFTFKDIRSQSNWIVVFYIIGFIYASLVVQLRRWKKPLRETYLYFFPIMSIFEDGNFCCWGECYIVKNSSIIKTNLEFSFRDK